MAQTRRGTAMLLLTAGDPEISGALADGITAVRGTEDLIRLDAERRSTFAQGHGYAHPIGGRLGEAKPLEPEQIRVVKAELDIQKAADLLRVAMHPEPVDYAGKMFDAEMEYGESLYQPGPMRKVGEFLLVRYALVVLAFDRLFKALGM